MLSIAISLSILVHGFLLTVNFISPKTFRFSPNDQKLDIVLVNTKHDQAPLKPDALAQANLDGGGKSKSDRTQSPIPDMQDRKDGDSMFTSKRTSADYRKPHKNLMSHLNSDTLLRTARHFKQKPIKSVVSPHDSSTAFQTTQALARSAAALALRVRDKEKTPKKTFISPSTKEVSFAAYYTALHHRIEQLGTLNFPQHNGKKLYGTLEITIPIYHDGTIYENEGGAQIKVSSSINALDAAALRIVRQAAPFGRFPPNMRAKYTDLWILSIRLEFTRDNALESN